MEHDSLYEAAICSWAEQQAAALPRLAARVRDRLKSDRADTD